MTTLLLALALQADEAAADAAIDAFKKATSSASAADRAAAALQLGRTPHPKTLAVLKGLLGKDEAVVRSAAARALGGFEDHRKEAAVALLNALGPNAREPGALAAILEAIGKVGDASNAPTLHRFFDEREPMVARASYAATAQIGSPASVDPLIEYLKKLETKAVAKPGSVDANPNGSGVIVSGDYALRQRAEKLIPEVNQALAKITGQAFGTAKDWQAWWSRNRAGFKPNKP
jgi:HEAT repeat protein